MPDDRRPSRRLRRLERHEVEWLAGGLGVSLLIWLFLLLAGEVTAGDTRAFDERLLLMFRRPEAPAETVGPVWLRTAMLDITALGGPTVLSLMVIAVCGFLLLQRRHRTALLVFLASASGEALNDGLKSFFSRPRPDVVSHLRDVASASFPSGHAMQSAIIYLTLGAIVMRVANGRVAKVYCMTLAVLLTALVGVSRVYLGVHYPTDVVGGWIVGFIWAMVCWSAARWYDRTTGDVSGERSPAREA